MYIFCPDGNNVFIFFSSGFQSALNIYNNITDYSNNNNNDYRYTFKILAIWHILSWKYFFNYGKQEFIFS